MENKRKGSRTYRTLTYHFQRNPLVDVKGTKVTYRGALAFLDKWEKLYRQHPKFQNEQVEITRSRDRVEVKTAGEIIMAAYFEEEKEKK